MRRLLLVSHRPVDQAGGPAARWRSFQRHLPLHGWEVDVLSAPARASADEFGGGDRARARARLMSALGRAAEPAFRLFGLRPEALPLSTTWIPRGAAQVQERLREGEYDAVLATGPPFVALVAARRAVGNTPLVLELRDLWAENPAVDRGSGLLRRLESWVLSGADAIVVVTPEAANAVRHRHPSARVEEITNGFEPELLGLRRPSRGAARTILHSGTLTADRPLRPLLRALPPQLRLVLHGYVAPQILREIEESGIEVEVLPPSAWEDAIKRIADADVCLVTQAGSAGDASAVAAKVYEYLALGKPVLCLSHGGATEALLRRLGADGLCARLDDQGSIEQALARITGGMLPAPVSPERLAPYERPTLASQLAGVLSSLTDQGAG